MSRRTFGTVWKEDGRWKIAFYLDGKRSKRAGGRNKTVAAKKLGKIERLKDDGLSREEILHEVFGDALVGRMSFADVAEIYRKRLMTGVANYNRKKTRRKDDQLVERIVKDAPFADLPIDLITPAVILNWRDGIAATVSAQVANRKHSKASAVVTWAIPHGHAERHPFRRVPKLPEPRYPIVTWLKPSEVRGIMTHYWCPIHRGIFVCAVSTGMRKGEILDLWWEDVKFDEGADGTGVIDLPHRITKTDRHRRIPMTPALRDVLLGLRESQGNPGDTARVFPRSAETAYARFKDALNACPDVPETKKPKVTFHVLRHTAASIMMQAGVPLHAVAEILGHSTLEVTRRYAHFAPDYGQEPIRMLAEALGLEGVEV